MAAAKPGAISKATVHRANQSSRSAARSRLEPRRRGRRLARRALCGDVPSPASPAGRRCVAERGKSRAGESEWHGAFARVQAVKRGEILRVTRGAVDAAAPALVDPMAVALPDPAVRSERWLGSASTTRDWGGPIGVLSVALAEARAVDDIVVSEPHAVPVLESVRRRLVRVCRPRMDSIIR